MKAAVRESHRDGLIGKRIGHIQVAELLGEGGMGAVYAGFDEKLRREVAVKVVRADLFGPVSKMRFLREARALSQLNHPNICLIYDFVERQDNDFLILERIHGRNLRHALEERLDFAAKLKIAEQIASALVAAHSKGIIHRDLKLGNVMLGTDGTVKVLDFGLAYFSGSLPTPSQPILLKPAPPEEYEVADEESRTIVIPADDATAVLARTEPGKVAGTATCMSPEQVTCQPLTVASDMYSFGLLLQELFTGSAPYDSGTSLPDLLKKVRKGETTPVTGLPRDLAALIGRLKSVAPAERPTAVEALGRLRWIQGKPSRRLRVIAAAGLALTLAAGAVRYATDLYKERNAALRARNEALDARREAEETAQFMVNLFKVADPGEARGNTITAREILDRGAATIQAELGGQPLAEARLLDAIGQTYYKLGLYDKARPILEFALKLRRRWLSPNHPDLAATLGNLGMVYQAQNEDAETLFLEALRIQEQALRPGDPAVAQTLNSLATLYGSRGELDRAEPLLERALRIRERALGPDHPDVATSLNNLAYIRARRGRHAEAEAMLRRGLAIREARLPADHPDLGANLAALAWFYMEKNDFARAEPLQRRSLEIWRKALGPDHPRLGLALSNLAKSCWKNGKLQEAEALYREAVDLRTRTLGADHPSVALSLTGLADLLAAQGRSREAETLYHQALAIQEKGLPPGHAEIRGTVEAFARFLRQAGREAEAVALERRTTTPPRGEPGR